MQIDRLSIRTPPPGRPVMYQTWDKLLFMHWQIPEEVLRPLIPERLEIDTYEGASWVGVTPFTMRGIRPTGVPAFPIVSRTHELNVRTYVHFDGVPGVWFFSLDASNTLAVLAARLGFALPYYQAAMDLQERDGEVVRFSSRRTHPGAPEARLAVEWRRGERLPEAAPGTLEFFLIERYCLYAVRGTSLFRSRIHHDPWPLCRAEAIHHASTMLASHGLKTPDEPPLLHGLDAAIEVGIWLPERL